MPKLGQRWMRTSNPKEPVAYLRMIKVIFVWKFRRRFRCYRLDFAQDGYNICLMGVMTRKSVGY